MKGKNMKNNDYSQPYRNLGFEKVNAPGGKSKNEPKVTKTVGTDLRVGGNKK